MQRLSVWNFAIGWEEDIIIPIKYYENIMKAYKNVETNKYFLKLTSYTLAIGNILNGGGPKGQSDGFELSVFGKVASMKDNTN